METLLMVAFVAAFAGLVTSLVVLYKLLNEKKSAKVRILDDWYYNLKLGNAGMRIPAFFCVKFIFFELFVAIVLLNMKIYCAKKQSS